MFCNGETEMKDKPRNGCLSTSVTEDDYLLANKFIKIFVLVKQGATRFVTNAI